jgi:hypothetical protein
MPIAIPQFSSPCPALIRRGRALLAWILDQEPAAPAVLRGQCCDRLRPSFVRQLLDGALRDQGSRDTALVDWHWDARSGAVRGLLLQSGLLQRFCWSPANSSLILQPQLLLSQRTPGR